jgi:hypothetical protein
MHCCFWHSCTRAWRCTTGALQDAAAVSLQLGPVAVKPCSGCTLWLACIRVCISTNGAEAGLFIASRYIYQLLWFHLCRVLRGLGVSYTGCGMCYTCRCENVPSHLLLKFVLISSCALLELGSMTGVFFLSHDRQYLMLHTCWLFQMCSVALCTVCS